MAAEVLGCPGVSNDGRWKEEPQGGGLGGEEAADEEVKDPDEYSI